MSVPRIDASYLRTEHPPRADDGVAAEWHADGHLKRLVRKRGGEVIRSLDLDGLGNGKATEFQGSGGTADWEVYADGKRECFDAWSDNSRPRPYDYETWVRGWIAAIEELDREPQ